MIATNSRASSIVPCNVFSLALFMYCAIFFYISFCGECWDFILYCWHPRSPWNSWNSWNAWNPWEYMKIHENLWKSVKISENHEITEYSWKSLELYENLQKPHGIHGKMIKGHMKIMKINLQIITNVEKQWNFKMDWLSHSDRGNYYSITSLITEIWQSKSKK